jgi:outer membrane protein OmpA-like peptidoglycan-associated protein
MLDARRSWCLARHRLLGSLSASLLGLALPLGQPAGAAPLPAAPASTPPAPFMELQDALEAAGAKLESLTKAASLAKAAAELRQQLATAAATHAELQAALAEERTRREAAEARATGAARELADLRAQLETAQPALRQSKQDLSAAQGELDGLKGENRELRAEVAALRRAADDATVAARRNLAAFERKLGELNDALAGVTGQAEAAALPAGREEAVALPAAYRRSDAANAPGWAPLPSPARDADPAAAGAGATLARLKGSDVSMRAAQPATRSVAALSAELSQEERLQVESLLADLAVVKDAQGLRMRVPGGSLFEVDGDEIDGGAYDSLARIAELVNVYRDHRVLIVGHTDAIGDPAYNRQLSQRRAKLIKDFFVENFDVAPERIAVAGKGEAEPIASNTTVDGRKANRRIEVVLLK